MYHICFGSKYSHTYNLCTQPLTEWSVLLTYMSSIADVWELINYLTAIVTYSSSPSRPGLLKALFN